MKAVILAAGIGSRIRPLTDTGPKFFLPIANKLLGEYMMENLIKTGITEFVVVTGYFEDRLKSFLTDKYPTVSFTFVHNEIFKETNTAYSLWLTKQHVCGDTFIKLDGDVYFEYAIIDRLINDSHPNCLLVDSKINLDKEEVKVITDTNGAILQVGKTIDKFKANGESIGIEKIGVDAGIAFFDELELLLKDKSHYMDYYDDTYTTLVAKNHPFHSVDISDLKWVEVDTHEDYKRLHSILEK